MNDWRCSDACTAAETYIEWRFEQKCRELRDGDDILTEWRRRKREYLSFSAVIFVDFLHFSRHDGSHSISILESIEMLLGKERIDKLSAGDLWMLLECAYMHDLGMSIDYDELKNLWENDSGFKEYIETALHNDDNDSSHKGATYYDIITQFIKNREVDSSSELLLEELFPKSWPVELNRSISVLATDYIRRNHSERLQRKVLKFDPTSNPVIPDRLNKAAVTACMMHGEDFDEILKQLCRECKGFGNTLIHPRFAAAMLRIGDMLDLDNNRFNPRAINRFGPLPHISLLHFRKHRAMTHVSILPTRIEIFAESDDSDTCGVASEWLNALTDEVKDLICHWNEMVPDELQGCLLNTCNNAVYLIDKVTGNKILFERMPSSDFEVNKPKLLELMVGLNIYTSRMDFIREYIQNALDASKMQLWLDIKNGKYSYSDSLNHNVDIYSITPFDIGQDIYNDYTIQISVGLREHDNKVLIIFSDCGIGMENDCIEALGKVGSGWRLRKKYNEDLVKMPRWLRPTGGFGIGVQSAFMVTDNVRIITFNQFDDKGTDIIMTSPKTACRDSGKVIQKKLAFKGTGTNIALEINVDEFYRNNQNYYNLSKSADRHVEPDWKSPEKQNQYINWTEKMIMSREESDKIEATEKIVVEKVFDPFLQSNVIDQVISFIIKYVHTIVPFSPIPIRIVRMENDSDERIKPEKGVSDYSEADESTVMNMNAMELISYSGKGKMENIIRSDYLPLWEYWKYMLFEDSAIEMKSRLTKQQYISVNYNQDEKDYLVLLECSSGNALSKAFIWDKNNQISYCVIPLLRGDKTLSPDNVICFKNILVKDEKIPDWPANKSFSIFADFDGFNAEKIIKIHREAFKEDFSRSFLPNYIFNGYRVAFSIIANMRQKDIINCKSFVSTDTFIFRFSVLKMTNVYEKLTENDRMEDVTCLKFSPGKYDRLEKTSISRLEFLRLLKDMDSSPNNGLLVCIDPETARKYSIKPDARLGDIVMALLDGRWQKEKINEYMNLKEGKGILNVIDPNVLRQIEKQRKEKIDEYSDIRPIIYALDKSSAVYVFEEDEARAIAEISNTKITYFSIFDYEKHSEDDILDSPIEPPKETEKISKYVFGYVFKEENKNDIKEGDFYYNSFNGAAKDGNRYIKRDVPKDFLPDIQVPLIPFVISQNTDSNYIISPISHAEYVRVMNILMSENYMSLEKFKSLIVDSESFNRVVDYVWKSRSRLNDSENVSKNHIRDCYIAYLNKVYDALVSKGFFKKTLEGADKSAKRLSE